MKCKGCQKEISEEAYQKVADWSFCRDCFEKLMQKPQKSNRQPDVDRTDSKPDPKDGLEKEKIVCMTCAKPVEEGQIKKIGTWAFCSACHADLVFRPPEMVLPADESDENGGAAEEGKTEDDDQSLSRVKERMNRSVDCHGCGRQILERGSKILEGMPYCPDCFYAKQEQSATAENHETRPDEISEHNSNLPGSKRNTLSNTGKKCESCGRDTDQAGLSVVDGFWLCEACLTTDKKLAVQIARKHHREHLKIMEKKLD